MKNDLGIPAFLKISAAKRAAAWVANPPRPYPTFEKPKIEQPIDSVIIEEINNRADQIRRNRTAARINRMMTKQTVSNIPERHRRWDDKKSAWCDVRIVAPKRLEAIAARTGIPLDLVCQYLNQENDMPKLTINSYRVDETEAWKRGSTSIDAAADEAAIQRKIGFAALRTGPKVHHIDVVDPEGKIETWIVDSDGKTLVSALNGAIIDLAQVAAQIPAPAQTTEESDVAKKTKTKVKAKSKGNGAAKTPRAKKNPGEVRKGSKTEIVANLLKRKNGCTAAEVLAATEWPAVSMPAIAKAAGLKLRKDKVKGEVTRYFGS